MQKKAISSTKALDDTVRRKVVREVVIVGLLGIVEPDKFVIASLLGRVHDLVISHMNKSIGAIYIIFNYL